MDHKGD